MQTTTTVPSYLAGLTELRTNLKQMLPSDSLNAFDRYGETLNIMMPEILKIRKGDKAPNFTLSNQLGNAIALSDLLKKGKVILVFYRGAWCPYCNLQLNQLQSILEEIKSANTNLVAISPQIPDASMSMVEKAKFGFEVLSDLGNNVARKFTTVYRHADYATDVIKSLGIDFEGYYSDDSYELPVPAVFIIGQDGTILFAKSQGGDFRHRVEPSEILAALQ